MVEGDWSVHENLAESVPETLALLGLATEITPGRTSFVI
jgi:hypothetical protein